MSRLQRYPKYKDSGVEWLDKIPEGWKVKPIRAIFRERNEKNIGIKTDYILSVTKDRGVIPYDEKGAVGNNKSEDIEKYKLVYPNDFVINKMNVVIGSLGMSKYYGAFSHVYLVYKPFSKNVNIKYFSYVFHNPIFYKSLIRICTGIMELRESLNKDLFKKESLPFPPLKEQTKIANYLDKKTAQIDRAITLKEKLIEKLKERRQVIINEAVTKGVEYIYRKQDFSPVKGKGEAKASLPEFKDSGVEWIGKIPKHWEVKKLKYILDINNGQDYKQVVASKGYPVIGSGGEFAKASKYLFDGEVLLLGRKGTINKPLYFKGKFWTVDTMFYAVAKNNNVTKFLYYSSLSIPFDYYSTSTALPSMTQFDLNNHKIPIPPLQEQQQIVDFIENQTSKIDKAITLQQNYIAKLKEYKASLIDSVVTGKVRVE